MKQKTVRNAIQMRLFIALILLSALQSCISKDDMDFSKMAGSEWNPNFSVPLIHSKLDIGKILNVNDSMSSVLDSLSSVTLVYKGDIYSIYGYQFLPLVDQTNSHSINLTPTDITTLTTNDSVTVGRNITYPFGVANGEHIDSMILGQGVLKIDISSTIRQSGVLTITLPSVSINGIPYSKQVPFTYSNQLPLIATGNFNLDGCDFSMTTGGAFNAFPIQYSVKFYNSANPTLTSETFSVDASFQNMVIKRVYGDFGLRNIPMTEDSTCIPIFYNANFGNIAFDDPKLKFSITNSYGVRMDAHFTSMYAQSNMNGNTAITGAPNPVLVQTPSSPGTSAASGFTLNKANSNIKTAINTNPQFIGYRLSAAFNPRTSYTDYIEDSSRFYADVSVELPLSGVAQDLVIQDTVDFALGDIKEIEWAKFRINTSNGFPLDANTQLYFVDTAYTVLDSLISSNEAIIRAGIVDPSTGIVNHPTEKITDEYFPMTRLRNIYNAKKIIVRSLMNSPGSSSQPVKFYPDYILDVRLAAQVQLKINVQ